MIVLSDTLLYKSDTHPQSTMKEDNMYNMRLMLSEAKAKFGVKKSSLFMVMVYG